MGDQLPDNSNNGNAGNLSPSLNLCEAKIESFYQSIYNAVEASIFVVDVLENGDFRYVGLNQAYERWTGIKAADLVGKTLEEVLLPADAVAVRSHYIDCLETGEKISYEEYLPLANDGQWWLTTLTPLRDRNCRIYRLIGSSTNITQRKQAETALALEIERSQLKVAELEKLVSLKDEFLKSITHELRTPISSITLATQTLEKILATKGSLDQNNRVVTRTLKTLQEGCQREIRLIDNLLIMSHADGEEKLSPSAISLKDWIPRVVASFREGMERREQKLEMAIAENLPILRTDPSYLERIFSELLNNACKYTPAGETIAVSAYIKQDKLYLSVSNSGVEISPDQVCKIFDKFYRLPEHDIWECGGAGLGLTVVQKLVERLGIFVQVDSQAGKTNFILEFPNG
jgi:PAS domain S-box-containing protein